MTIGTDTVIYPHVVIEGASAIGSECVVGAGCHLTRTTLGDRVTLKPYCVLGDSVVEQEAILGPFCHLRPESHVGAGAHIGNFVELKKTRLGKGSKANHLAYLGDATVGEGVNVGAGVITCNYDGLDKHATTIQDEALHRHECQPGGADHDRRPGLHRRRARSSPRTCPPARSSSSGRQVSSRTGGARAGTAQRAARKKKKG